MSVFDHLLLAYDEEKARIDAIADSLTPFIAEAVTLLSDLLLEGKKIFTHGSMELQCAADQVAKELIVSSRFERPPFQALALSPLISGSLIDNQLQGLAAESDALLLFTHEQDSDKIQNYLQFADVNQLSVICLYPEQSTSIAAQLSDNHVGIPLANSSLANQLFIGLLIVKLLEKEIFGQ